MSTKQDTVWDQYYEGLEINRHFFMLLFSLWIVAGLAFTGFVAQQAMTLELGAWSILGLFVVAIIGSVIASVPNGFVAFFGYGILSASFGAMLGPVLRQYTTASILKVVLITGVLVAVFGVIGLILPKIFEGWGVLVLGTLVLLIVGQFSLAIIGALGVPVEGALTFWDWVGIVIFCGIVVFDFNRAAHVRPTFASAICCAAGVYLDFMNIFLRLLGIKGEKK